MDEREKLEEQFSEAKVKLEELSAMHLKAVGRVNAAKIALDDATSEKALLDEKLAAANEKYIQLEKQVEQMREKASE